MATLSLVNHVALPKHDSSDEDLLRLSTRGKDLRLFLEARDGLEVRGRRPDDPVQDSPEFRHLAPLARV